MRRAIVLAVVAVLGPSPGCATTRGTARWSDDDEITSRIARRFMNDGRVSWVDIEIDTRDAVVTLRGITDDPAERRRAEELASDTPGVREVVNRITVGPERPRPPR